MWLSGKPVAPPGGTFVGERHMGQGNEAAGCVWAVVVTSD